MLETKVGSLEALRSSEAEIFVMDSEGIPATRVPKDSRAVALLSCQQIYMNEIII